MNINKNPFKLSALTASLLLHGVVLISLIAVPTRGPAPEPGVMMTWLAMPAMVPERVAVTTANPGNKTVTKAVQFNSTSQVKKKTKEVIPRPVPKEIPVAKPVQSEKNQTSDQPVLIPELVEDVVSLEAIGSTLEDLPTTEKSEIKSFTQNPKSKTQNSANAMLAFAGDPATLGMIVPDVPGPDLVEAVILSLPEPTYPVLSRKRGEEGRVVLEVTISAQGAVRRAQIKASSSFPRLDRAALSAVKKAAFSPATEYGTPVESVTKVAYRFELEGR